MQANLAILDDVVRSVVEGASSIELGMADDGPPSGSERYCAEVALLGSWSGSLRVEIEPSLARELVSAMLPGEEAVDELCTMDAVGELANMIAGNLRPMIRGARSLGIPVVERRRSRKPLGAPVLGRSFDGSTGHMEVELFAAPGASDI